VALFYDHAYFHLLVRERIQQIRDALHFHDRSHREQWNEAFQPGSDVGPPVTDGRVILGPDTRETIRQVRHELALLDFADGGGKGRAALEILESLPTWRYLVELGPKAAISLTTTVNDFDVMLHLLPARAPDDPFRISGALPSPAATVPAQTHGESPSSETEAHEAGPNATTTAQPLGRRLREFRERHDLAQKQIAAGLHRSISWVSRVEDGTTVPDETASEEIERLFAEWNPRNG
jgi:hypothetical protein